MLASEESSQRALRQGPWQFRLGALLTIVALVGVTCAILVRVGGTIGVGLIWGALLVAAHVVANVQGSRRTQRRATIATPATGDDPPAEVPQTPPTLLHRRTRVGRITLALTSTGATLGGSAGWWTLASLYPAAEQRTAVLVGAGSAALLGGLLGFLLCTCCGATIQAWHEATRQTPRT